ncbi:MAG: hypothetical protein AAF745_16110 [Planctomycetota bacterium]
MTPDEASHVEDVLTRLRDHFKVWPTESGKEWYLVDLAYYEGCGRRDQYCVEILPESAPLAVGSTLVHDHGFEWCAIHRSGSARFSVRHSGIADPIDLYELESTPMLDPDHHDDDMKPFEPGEGAHESMHAILRLIGQTVAYG